MKTIWKLAINDFVAATASMAFSVYTIWYLGAVLHDQKMVAVFGSLSIINILLTPLGGRFADQVAKITIIKYASMLRCLLFALFFISYYVTHQLVLLLIALNLLLSILGSFYGPAIESIAPDYATDESELIYNNSLISIATQVATIAGAALGGVLIMLFDVVDAYAVVLGLLMGSALLVLFIKKPVEAATAPVVGASKRSLWEDLKITLQIPIIKRILPYAAIVNLSFWLYWYLMPLYLSQQLPQYPIAYSVQDLIIGVSALLGGLYLSKHANKLMKMAKNYPKLLLLQALGLGLLPVSFQLMSNQTMRFGFLIIAWLGYGIFSFFANMIFVTAIQQQVPGKMLGLVMGIVFAIFGSLAPIASVISGFFARPSNGLILLIALPMIIIPIIMNFDHRIGKSLVAK
ncbi:MFS transporter [Fructilactobacillus florum]|uniref:Efflux transporter protein n=1 Tax=Fructilactobacillus florum DSM 22689 = JCM 16035 TaxID=1423745 RepID=A0A0R2CHC5_9LACO|nr:MFS transporter [Fructilactobacillus florum]KRM90514.1 efflux transporter protein [Fructilactobacillus florum DSM 22689 = JCM 16035]